MFKLLQWIYSLGREKGFQEGVIHEQEIQLHKKCQEFLEENLPKLR